MKYFILLISCILTASLSFSQTPADLYKKGDSLFEIKDYKNSALAYAEGIRVEGKNATNDKYWDAASLWALANYMDSAFAYLNTLANTKELNFSDFVTIMNDIPYYVSLKKDPRWQQIKDGMFLSAKQTFLSTTKKNGGINPNYELIGAAFAWAMFNKDSAYKHLQMVANSKAVSFGSYNSIRTASLLSSLHDDSRWQPLLETVYKKAEKTFTTPQDSTYTQEEIIYGRKDGMALTMIHLKPKLNSNHKAIIQIMSGGWRSSFLNWDVNSSLPYLRRGYSVFVVVHGSSPVYAIPDAVADLQRAVRFIRYHAKDYQIEPDKIGITGASAGGHLSLLCGLMDIPGDNSTGDPIDLVSSKVQAVACYYPPTDFLNWGIAGLNFMNAELLKAPVFNHLLEFRKWNPQRRLYSYITDTTEIIKILYNISPLNNVSANDAPVLIIHGDKDQTVPLQQSQSLVKKLQEMKVLVSLTIKKGAGHGWDRDESEVKMFIDWFDKYLK